MQDDPVRCRRVEGGKEGAENERKADKEGRGDLQTTKGVIEADFLDEPQGPLKG